MKSDEDSASQINPLKKERNVSLRISCSEDQNTSKTAQQQSQHTKPSYHHHKMAEKVSEMRGRGSKFLSLSYYMNHLTFILFMFAYFIVQIVLVILQFKWYKVNNKWVITARLCGILINFNMAFIVFLVARRITTWLRNTRIGQMCFPFDYFINLHKQVGLWILLLSIVHTIAHSVNLYNYSSAHLGPLLVQPFNSTYNITKPTLGFGDLLFTTKSGIGWFHSLAMPTGWAVLALLIIMTVFSASWFRKRGLFELFHYAHFIHIIIYLIMIFHAKNFWKWFIFPAFILLIEFLTRTISTFSENHGSTFIKDVNILPSKVTHLVMSRPRNFKFKAGDYVFINIPKLSVHEWHPFTISSSPELKDEIWLHIRRLGNWTGELHDHFLNMQKENKSTAYIKENLESVPEMSNDVCVFNPPLVIPRFKLNCTIANEIKNVFYKVYIDGPYGTPSNRTFRTEHAILISSGIGVTPFASILQSVWFKYSKCSHLCPNCNFSWYDEFKEKKLKKVDFIWVNQDFKSFEWFIDLLAQIERLQSESKMERFIDIHLFMTGAKTKEKIKNDAMESLLSLKEKKDNFPSDFLDLIEKIEPGRPNLDKLLGKILLKKKADPEVIFCGSPQFGKVVKQKSLKYKLKFNKENF